MSGRALKVYGMTLAASPCDYEALGYTCRQVRAIVKAPSQRVAAEAFGLSLSAFRAYGCETWNDEELAAAVLPEPGTVLIRGNDHFTGPYVVRPTT